MDLQPLCDAQRLRWLEGLVQGQRVMGVQVVHHQHYSLLVGVVFINQFPHHLRPVGPGAPIRDLHSPPPLQGRKQHEPVAHPLAPVFVIVGHGGPGLRRAGLPGLLHQLLAGLIQAHQHFLVIESAMIDLQHVLHGAYQLGAALGREAPALLQPGLQFVFFRVRRTVSALMLSTISRSTNPSASSCRVQLTRPWGG